MHTLSTPPLISAADLATGLAAGGPPPVLLDCSFDLADPAAGRRAYRAAHLPGALYADLDTDLSGAKTGRNGRHPLPARADLAATAGRWGIAPGRLVVACDGQGGMYAARAWWLLLWLGHAEVQVLAAGGALEAGDGPAPEAGAPPYPAAKALVATLDADALQAGLGRVLLLDARAPERFRGDVEPLDARAGHIPGARNHFFKNNLQPDGRFRPAAELQAAFDAYGQPPAHVVHQCGSGVTACHNLLAMAVAGRHGALLYPGSWSEWSADPARPVAVGG